MATTTPKTAPKTHAKGRKLTDLIIPQLGPGEHSDAGIPAPLVLRVSPTGKREWQLRYRAKDAQLATKQFRERLGTYPQMGLSEARQAALARMKEIQSAPPGELGTPGLSDISTLADLWARYKDRKLPHLAKTTQIHYARTWTVHIEPRLGTRRIDRLQTREITELLEDCAANARNTGAARATGDIARHVRSLLNVLYRYAGELGLASRNPVATAPRIRLGKPRAARCSLSASDTDPNAVMRVETLCAKISDAKRMDEGTRLALRLILLTGLRRAEVVALKWEHIHLEERKLEVVAGKGGKNRTVWLCSAAVRLLEQRRAVQAALDPQAAGPCQIHPATLATTMRRLTDGRLSPHDLRRTCATALGALGCSLTAIGRLLGHGDRDAVSRLTAIYDRGNRRDELLEPLERWGEQLFPVDQGQAANVVPIHSAPRGA
jgi:integrase